MSLTLTPLRLEANRANAELSTGPRSEEGKLRSSRNSIKHGLTSRIVLLTEDQLDDYQALREEIIRRYRAVTTEEGLIVERIVDSEWRLLRIPEIMEGIYALGHTHLTAEVDSQFKDLDAPSRAVLLRTRIHLHYKRDLNNLALQESRIRRNLEKDIAALEVIQKPRFIAERNALASAAQSAYADPDQHGRAYFQSNGFVFSDADWEDAIFRVHAARSPRSGNGTVARIEFRRQFAALLAPVTF